MCYPDGSIVFIKEPLLLIGPCGGSRISLSLTEQVFLFTVIWHRTVIVREETRYSHMGFRLAVRVLSTDRIIHTTAFCYTSRGAI